MSSGPFQGFFLGFSHLSLCFRPMNMYIRPIAVNGRNPGLLELENMMPSGRKHSPITKNASTVLIAKKSII